MLSMALGLIDKNNLPNATQANKSTLDKAFLLTMVVVSSIALMLTVIAGFRYVISEGDPARVADARRQLIYTGVGLIVAASSTLLINAVLDVIK